MEDDNYNQSLKELPIRDRIEMRRDRSLLRELRADPVNNFYAEPLEAHVINARTVESLKNREVFSPGKSMKQTSSKTIKVAATQSENGRKRPSSRQKSPGTIQPMAAKTADSPFSAEGWIFEPKLDGVRALGFIRGDEVTLLSRRNLDLTERYPRITSALQSQNYNLILDGEITAIDESGRPSFQLLQRAGQIQNLKSVRIIFYVFDILFADNESVIDRSFEERRALLRKYVKQSDVIKIVSDLGTDGIKAFELCVAHDLEGVIAKRLQGKYFPGHRSGDWLKVKSFKSTEFVICGYTAGAGARDDTFGSLILGYYDESGQLRYAGGVGTGFNQILLTDLVKRMKPLIQRNSPFKKKIAGKSGITWIEPKLVAEIKFSEWTSDRILRIPVFLRLRDDVPPEQVKGL